MDLSRLREVYSKELCFRIFRVNTVIFKINLYHSIDIFSRRQIYYIVSYFSRKQGLTFHANCKFADRRQFASNRSRFLGKIRKQYFKILSAYFVPVHQSFKIRPFFARVHRNVHIYPCTDKPLYTNIRYDEKKNSL